MSNVENERRIAELAAIDYSRVDEAQAIAVCEAMQDAAMKECFDVTFLPLKTAEQRRAAAAEWAGHYWAQQQLGVVSRGGAEYLNLIEATDGFRRLIEDKEEPKESDFVTYAVLRAVKKRPGVDIINLFLRRETDDAA